MNALKAQDGRARIFPIARPIEYRSAGGDAADALPLDRILRLLGATNQRLSLFTFESLPGGMSPSDLQAMVLKAVDDDGIAFELADGRIAALVYGWRPPNAPDSWVEDRTIDRLDWALGGPCASADAVDVYAAHRWSAEVSDAADIMAALSFAAPVRQNDGALALA